jgi:hypothetical protein
MSKEKYGHEKNMFEVAKTSYMGGIRGVLYGKNEN